MKIRNNNKSDASIRSETESIRNEEELDEEENDHIEKNKTVAKIEELIESLSIGEEVEANKDSFTYIELLALYEKEKNCRIDLETTFQQKAKEANKHVNKQLLSQTTFTTRQKICRTIFFKPKFLLTKLMILRKLKTKKSRKNCLRYFFCPFFSSWTSGKTVKYLLF